MKPSIVTLLNTCGPTTHFRRRAHERGLPREIEEFIVTWGTTLEAPHHATYFTIVQNDLPWELQDSSIARRAEGWILVVSDRGSLLTCYRRHNAWHTLKRERNGRTRRAA